MKTSPTVASVTLTFDAQAQHTRNILQDPDVTVRLDLPFNADAPPLPSEPVPQPSDSPDYFSSSSQMVGSLSLEPNPFEQSFGGAPVEIETVSGAKLPSVATLTSPTSLILGSVSTPFNWGSGSLRTGPLSPAMLSAPANDYFSDTHHLRGGFSTPNESSLRTGLTPGGSGSMFPLPSPNTQALYVLATSGATPSTLEFHRSSFAYSVKRDQPVAPPFTQPPPLSQIQSQQTQQTQQTPQAQQTQHAHVLSAPLKQSQPSHLLYAPQADLSNGLASLPKSANKAGSGSYDPHANDAANGLFLLAQGRIGTQNSTPFALPSDSASTHTRSLPPVSNSMGTSTSPQISSANGRALLPVLSALRPGTADEPVSPISDEDDLSKANNTARRRGKKGKPPLHTGRRKTNDASLKPPRKKVKMTAAFAAAAVAASPSSDMSDFFDEGDEFGKLSSKSKMTDDEKRRNFLERNRVAALKCRQRKKQWLQSLQSKVETYGSENDSLTQQIAQLKEEVVHLKTLLMAHRDCPVTQQQGLQGAFLSEGSEGFTPQTDASFRLPSGVLG